jgi:hypothetical protein
MPLNPVYISMQVKTLKVVQGPKKTRAQRRQETRKRREAVEAKVDDVAMKEVSNSSMEA